MTTQGPTIEAAVTGDVPAIAELLREAGLPHEDFAEHIEHILVVRAESGAVVGVVGAEVHAPDALLRSLVVAPTVRGVGLGNELLRRLDARGAAWGVGRWWLLTTTAEKFFTARGFTVAERADAPEAIRRTGQFNGGCGCAAVCLTRARGSGP